MRLWPSIKCSTTFPRSFSWLAPHKWLWPLKYPNTKYWDEKPLIILSNVNSLRVSLGGTYTEATVSVWQACWFAVRKISMVPGDCDGFRPLRWWWWLFTPIVTYFEKEKFKKKVVVTKPELTIITMFSPIFVLNLMTNLKNKPSNAMVSSLNGPLCAYLMRQNLHKRTRPRS